MHLDRITLRAAYTIFVVVALASLDNAVIGLFPPLFSSIAGDLNIDISLLGLISAINIFTTAASSIVWGYLADLGKRKLLIIIGTILWSVSVFLTAYSQNYIQLMIYQIITGIGLGCIASIGYSVLTDSIPKRMRGMLMSLWGLSQGFGGIAGSLLASIMAPAAGWRKPFEIIAILGLSFIFLYFFIKEPPKGASEPELADLVREGNEYNYAIEFSHLKEIITKKSNKWLIFQGLFMNITTGTLIWLPTLYISKLETAGLDSKTSIIASGYLFALLQAGGLFSIYFGHLGDRLQRSSYEGRVYLTAFSVFISMPLYILMLTTPYYKLHLYNGSNPGYIFLNLLQEIITNPWLLLMFSFAIAATAAQSVNSPNWLALITDANLPENRATAFSIANLVNGAGRAVGNVFFGIVLKYFTPIMGEPDNYVFSMVLFQLFLIPSAYCYIKLSHNIGRDLILVKSTLKKRARIV